MLSTYHILTIGTECLHLEKKKRTKLNIIYCFYSEVVSEHCNLYKLYAIITNCSTESNVQNTLIFVLGTISRNVAASGF